MAYQLSNSSLPRLRPGMIIHNDGLGVGAWNPVNVFSNIAMSSVPLMMGYSQAQANYAFQQLAAQAMEQGNAYGKIVVQENVVRKQPQEYLTPVKPKANVGVFHAASTEPPEPANKQRIEVTETPLVKRDLGSF